MKKALIVVLAFYWCSPSIAQSLHSFTFKNIDGNNVNLGSYQDSSILLICLAPIKADDSIRINEIDSLVTRYGSKMKMIGVMSIEDGFIDSNKTAIKNLYSNRGITITLTEGMYTRKSSSNQSVLLNWLTSKTQNLRFNVDAKGIGQKFFIDKYGKMFAVLPPEVPFISPIVENYINRKS